MAGSSTADPVMRAPALQVQWVWLRVSFQAPFGVLFDVFWRGAKYLAVVAAVLVHQSLVLRVLI